jgi:hypothetical protein
MSNPVLVKTTVGTAMWAKVNTVIDTNPQGKRTYQVKLELPDVDEKALIADLTKKYKAFQALPEHEGKDWRAKPRLGFKPDKKSKKIQFMFWTYPEFTNEKTKEVTKRTIPVQLKTGEVISDKAIGNGSFIQVLYEVKGYHTSEDANGLMLLLHGILVHKLETFGGDNVMDAFEFDDPADTMMSKVSKETSSDDVPY